MSKKSEIFSTSKIEKRNILNELRSNNMTLQELRFFSIYLSKINARDKSTRKVQFPLADYQKIMNFNKMNLSRIRTSTNSLLGKVVNIPNDDGGYTGFTLFKRCKLFKKSTNRDNEWFIEIEASDDALPLMFDFKEKYFTYELWNALRLKSANQIRMYEILKQYEKIGTREIEVAKLRELLGIAPEEYPRWNNFKPKVLDSCQKALAEHTDICFTYERGRTGRGGKWFTIIFHIFKNENYVDQLTLDEFINIQPTNTDNANANSNAGAGIEISENIYDNENIEFLAGACNDEFDSDEMNEIFALISPLEVENFDTPHSTQGIWFDRERYLYTMYRNLNVATSRAEKAGKPIRDRYKYFVMMIRKDIHKRCEQR